MKTFKQFIIEKTQGELRREWAKDINKLLKEYGLRKHESHCTSDDCDRNYWNRSENTMTMQISVDPNNLKIKSLIHRGMKPNQMIEKIKDMLKQIKDTFNKQSETGSIKSLYLDKDNGQLLIVEFI